jgi:CheY-like chemotaxis protein
MTATVLVVDDEPDLEVLVLRRFRRQIRDARISFVFARDGIEALQSIEQYPHVDLVVMDINMPRIRSPAIICGGCSTAPMASASRWDDRVWGGQVIATPIGRYSSKF